MSNKLSTLYRSIKTFTRLPSNGEFYDSSVIDIVKNTNEVGVQSMTASDELMFKNPDALLNGEAIRNALISCVPGLKQPEKLLVNDVDALMVAIRIATYGEEMDISVKCPSCENENTFALDLTMVQNTMGTIEKSYTADLNNGTIVTVRPYLYEDNMKASLDTFEQTKLLRTMDNESLSEEEKLKIFDKTFKSMVASNINMLSNSILTIENDQHEIYVEHTDETHEEILGFLKNIDKIDSDIIVNKVKEINSIGISKKIDVKCEFCKHEWQSPIEFDPVSFFSGS